MSRFCDEAFDQVISINTIEHIGIGNDALDDDDDVKTVKEF
jgi:cyclopropane fatty-acyl-phospholipid synthase-like methyltransferase